MPKMMLTSGLAVSASRGHLDRPVFQPLAVDGGDDAGIRQDRHQPVGEPGRAGDGGRQRRQTDVEDVGHAAEVVARVLAGPDADLEAGRVVVDRDERRAAVGRR